MGKQWKQWQTLFFGGSKITVDGNCSHEIKTLAPWKESYDQPRQHMQKQKHYFANKGPSSQSCGFPVVMYGCKIWTIKKVEHWRVGAFELWCWRKLLRVPWITRRSNQSLLKEISPGCSLEGLMLKLKLQYFGHLMWGTDSLEKTLMLGKIEGGRRRRWQRMRGLDGIIDSMDMNEFEEAWGVGDGQGSLVCYSPWGCKIRHDWVTKLNWTELNCTVADGHMPLLNTWNAAGTIEVVFK